MNNIDKELVKLIASALECEESSITQDVGLGKHYNWDSLGHVAVMTALEEKYNIEIDDNNISELLNFSDIKEYICQYAKK